MQNSAYDFRQHPAPPIITSDNTFLECSSLDNLFVSHEESVYVERQDRQSICQMPTLFEHSRTSPGAPEFKGQKYRLSAPYWWNENTKIPALKVFSLQDAHVFGGKIRSREPYGYHAKGQLTLRQDMSLFESSGGIMDGITSLPSDLLAARDEGRYHLTISDEPEFFSGDYYLIGSIHSHFGHFMLEGLSRLWAATLLPAHIFSQLRFVVYEPAISPYAMTCMQLFGIRKEQLIFCPPHAVFDRLFVPAPSYRSHWWAQPEQVRTWDRIAERATAERQHPYPEKVFFSRRNIKERRLSNIDDVEDAFAHAGYAIVAPETFPIGDQIRMAYSAKALAGCVGSAMYLAAFQKKAEIPTIIVGPRSFYLKDDSIIADIKGNNLVVALGTETSESEEKLWYADVGSIRSAIDHTR